MKLIVGNQKTYLLKSEALDFIEKTSCKYCNDVVICPSFTYIDMFSTKSKFIVGSQNVSSLKLGATTGEVSAEQLKELNVKYSIVGHSERRSNQLEDSLMLYNKIKCLLDNDIKPIFCIGEHLEEKEHNVTKDVIGKQILDVFDKLEVRDIENIIIAYEPIWAIGSGLIPTNEEIIDTTNYIKDLVNDKYGTNVLVLYGGSVNKKNISLLNEIDIIDGYLIGGASTKPEEFLFIMNEVCK